MGNWQLTVGDASSPAVTPVFLGSRRSVQLSPWCPLFTVHGKERGNSDSNVSDPINSFYCDDKRNGVDDFGLVGTRLPLFSPTGSPPDLVKARFKGRGTQGRVEPNGTIGPERTANRLLFLPPLLPKFPGTGGECFNQSYILINPLPDFGEFDELVSGVGTLGFAWAYLCRREIHQSLVG